MPPRKRAETRPDADEPTPAEETQAPQSDDEQPAAATRKPRKPAAEPPCPECFPAGWPDAATSVGCGHGTWNRTL